MSLEAHKERKVVEKLVVVSFLDEEEEYDCLANNRCPSCPSYTPAQEVNEERIK